MVLSTESERTNLSGRGAGETALANGDDLTGGVEAAIADVQSFTVYLSVDGAVNVDVRASPDGGDSWYSLPEGPVRFESAGDEAIHVRYNMTDLKLVASNDTAVTAQIRQVV